MTHQHPGDGSPFHPPHPGPGSGGAEHYAGMDGDFLKVLRTQGHNLDYTKRAAAAGSTPEHGPLQHTEGTTVFAYHCRDGILAVGDHRATTGNFIFTDKAEKILELDDHSLMAIAGSPAVAMEMARTLRTTFEYYRRSQLQRMSLAAKIRALSQMLRENLPGTLQGFGIVSPIFCGFEPGRHGHPEKLDIYFYDPLGAHFRAAQFAGSGSGSLSIKSVLKHMDRWGDPRPAELDLPDAVRLGIRLLMTASELDSATGGVTPEMNSYPTMQLLNRDGIRNITPEEQAKFWLDESATDASDNASGSSGGGRRPSSGKGSTRKSGTSRGKSSGSSRGSAGTRKSQTKGGGSSK